MANYKLTVDGEMVMDSDYRNPKTSQEDIFHGLQATVNAGKATPKEYELYLKLKKKFDLKKATGLVNDKIQNKDAQLQALMNQQQQNG